mmetsp:Transcript_60813/g.133081  ORF Transcript_60813/g.133081 Transcript_60813/m.133081 type:complete len:239 (-) Transcript_60813:372-1088(-)
MAPTSGPRQCWRMAKTRSLSQSWTKNSNSSNNNNHNNNSRSIKNASKINTSNNMNSSTNSTPNTSNSISSNKISSGSASNNSSNTSCTNNSNISTIPLNMRRSDFTISTSFNSSININFNSNISSICQLCSNSTTLPGHHTWSDKCQADKPTFATCSQQERFLLRKTPMQGLHLPTRMSKWRMGKRCLSPQDIGQRWAPSSATLREMVCLPVVSAAAHSGRQASRRPSMWLATHVMVQ